MRYFVIGIDYGNLLLLNPRASRVRYLIGIDCGNHSACSSMADCSNELACYDKACSTVFNILSLLDTAMAYDFVLDPEKCEWTGWEKQKFSRSRRM